MSDDHWELHALKYAHLDRRSPANFIDGDTHDVAMPLDYFVWVARNGARTFVIDTGFGAAAAARRNRVVLRPVGEAIKTLGIEADTVEDVVVTHMHYDHAGNIDLFPKARLHVQDCEVDYVTGRCMCHRVLSRPFEAEDVVSLVRRVFAGDVRFHDGDAELAPGLSLHHVGGHTRGMQVVRAMTQRGPVVLASDLAHFYRHFDERRIFPDTLHLDDVLAGYERVEALAGDAARVVPGHDPRVLDLYPASAPALEGWAARLDVEPQRVR